MGALEIRVSVHACPCSHAYVSHFQFANLLRNIIMTKMYLKIQLYQAVFRDTRYYLFFLISLMFFGVVHLAGLKHNKSGTNGTFTPLNVGADCSFQNVLATILNTNLYNYTSIKQRKYDCRNNFLLKKNVSNESRCC